MQEVMPTMNYPHGSPGGSGVTNTDEGFVHVHIGTLDDDNSSGCKSDLNISNIDG